MSSFSSSDRRAERLQQTVDEYSLVSRRVYNFVMGGVLLYGLLMNVLLCIYATDFAMRLPWWTLTIGYFILAMLGCFITARSKNALISFLGYNMVAVPLGLVVATIVEGFGGAGSYIVVNAFFMTMVVTMVMMAASFFVPQFFAKIGGILGVVLFGLLLVSLLQFFFGTFNLVAFIGAILFSLYIGYDMYRAQQFEPTMDNAVDSALDLYLDIVNLFLFILRILGRGGRRR